MTHSHYLGMAFHINRLQVTIFSMKEEDDPSYKEDEEVEEKEETSETKEESQEKNESDSPAEKSASTGIHAYKSRGGEYVNYYIIDFDEGYVYSFSEGNGNDTCDKLKIESGDLNSGVVITYHDGGDEWSYILHYQYVDQPAHLILVDNDGFGWDFYETLLDLYFPSSFITIRKFLTPFFAANFPYKPHKIKEFRHSKVLECSSKILYNLVIKNTN